MPVIACIIMGTHLLWYLFSNVVTYNPGRSRYYGSARTIALLHVLLYVAISVQLTSMGDISGSYVVDNSCVRQCTRARARNLRDRIVPPRLERWTHTPVISYTLLFPFPLSLLRRDQEYTLR